MPFSIWEYLRERTRDAVLSGFQDALDIAEQGDTEGSQHDAANRLRSRLAAGSLNLTTPNHAEIPTPAAEAKSLPHPSMNGQSVAKPAAAAPARTASQPPTRPADASTFDDEIESRLNGVAAQNGQETAPQATTATTHIGRAKRGRPPKNREGHK